MGTCFGVLGVSPLPRQAKYARATRDLVIVDAPADANGVFADASPAVADQDLSAWSLTTNGGYSITSQQDGGFSIASGGDTSRQSFNVDHYDRTVLRWTGDTTFYVNNQAPTVGDPTEVAVLVLTEDAAMTPEDLEPYASDFEGDTLTVTAIDALPSGLDLTSNTLSGTPDTKAINHTTFRWTDVAGDYVEGDVTIIVGTITVPNVSTAGTSQSQAEDALDAVYLTPSVTTAYSDTVPEGEVIDQDPAADSEVAAFSTVTITVSLGEEPEEPALDETTGGLVKRRRKYVVQIDNRTFSVDSPQQAVQMLQQAREMAQAHAEALARKAIPRTRKRGNKPVKLPTPKISSPNPELKAAVSEARQDINAIYRNASRDIELAYHMARQAEDEEESLLLLM